MCVTVCVGVHVCNGVHVWVGVHVCGCIRYGTYVRERVGLTLLPSHCIKSSINTT